MENMLAANAKMVVIGVALAVYNMAQYTQAWVLMHKLT